MNATLEKEIATLKPEEKRQLIDVLWQQLEPEDDDYISPELLQELERCADAYDANPIGGMTLEQFEKKIFLRNEPPRCLNA